MLIISYILLLQLSELFSIMIPAIIFLILRYIFRISVNQMKQYFKKWTLPKIVVILLIIESSAFFIVYPLSIRVFTELTTQPKLCSYFILLLQLLPWIIKCIKFHEIVTGKKEENKDHAIYQ